MHLFAFCKALALPRLKQKKLLKTLLIMKFTALLISACLQVSAGGLAQTVSLQEKNASLKEIFKEIHRQTGYEFLYTSRILARAIPVDITAKDAPLEEVLVICFSKQPLTYTISDKTIVVKPRDEPQPAISDKGPRVPLTVSGTITDPKGNLMPGVNIVEKGTTNGTSSDAQGKYIIDVGDDATLVFSFIGFKTIETQVNRRSVINILMESDVASLKEIVVVGYGTIERKDLTGSVASVSKESIEKMNTASLNDAIQGMAAGVQVTSSSGTPGEGSNIIIRGGSSISASNEPLYVIDGFPQLGGDNMDLNPQNIESIDVLKDASAGAIYGARAANGVIIITTKSGAKNQKPKISYTNRYIFSEAIKKIETLDIVEYARVQQFFAQNASDSALYENPEAFSDSISIDWQDELFNSTLTQTHDLQISGGGANTKYSASLGYYDQEGIVKNTGYRRINSRLRLESDLATKLKAGVNISFSSGQRTGPGFAGQFGLGSTALVLRPYLPQGVFGGDLIEYDDPTFTIPGALNPFRALEKWKTENNSLKFRTINFLEYEPVKNLTLKASGTLDYSNSRSKSYQPSDVGFAAAYNGIATIGYSEVTSWLYENTANYKINLSDHKIQALAGFSAQTTIGESHSIRSTNFSIENLGADNIGLGVDVQNPSSNKYKATIASFFGRLNYDFSDKYLVTASIRYDGSSNLGKTNKWGAFPSGAIAWRASEEYFIKDLNIFSDLKFRASYGITGNNSIGYYQSLLTYRAANISLNSSQALGQRPNSMPNGDLKWERNEQVDIGVDVGIFNGRLTITADYYKKQSNDLLLNAPVPINSGFTTFTSNIGNIQSTGYELDVRGNILTGEVKWNSQFNIAFPSTKVLKLSATDYFFTGTAGNKSNLFKVEEGQPLGSFYGYVFDGINQSQEDLDSKPQLTGAQVGGPRYADISGPEEVPDGVITAEDRTIVGNGLPDMFGGFSNQFSYKNFDLSFIVTYRFGIDILNANKNFLTAAKNRGGPTEYTLNAWTPENPTNEYWGWGKDSGQEFYNVTSWLVEDGSFIRLNNITLGYSLPQKFLQTIKIQNFRVFVSGDKILTLSGYSGYDPEVSASSSMLTPGIDLTAYPHQKKMTVGVNITF